MKVYVQYDATGAIQSLVTVDATDAPGVELMLEAKPGLYTDEVEGVDADPEDFDALQRLADSHKVQARKSRPIRLLKQ